MYRHKAFCVGVEQLEACFNEAGSGGKGRVQPVHDLQAKPLTELQIIAAILNTATEPNSVKTTI